MKKGFGVLVLVFAACNYDAGECYLRGQEGGGVGGGVLPPVGVGGFGDVPPEPQDATDPANPCAKRTAECTLTWKADSDVCKSKGTSGTCTTLYQCDHSTLAEAQAACDRTYGPGSGVESCGSCRWVTSASGKTCTDMFVDCQDKGWPCTRQTIWGTTLCAACRDDCQADVPYRTGECYDCGYE